MANFNRYLVICIFIGSFIFSAKNTTNLDYDHGCTDCYEPIADAGEDKRYFQGVEVFLDGSNSYDPANLEGILSYYWTSPIGIELIYEENPSSPSFMAPVFDDLLEGCSNLDYDNNDDCLMAGEIWVEQSIAYIPIRLTVNDGEYNSNYDEVIISVIEENTPPVLDIELDYILNRLSEFTIDTSSASDENSLTGVLDFIWDYNDFIDFGGEIIDDNENSIRVFKTPEIGGIYTIRLTLSDGYNSVDFEFTIDVLSFIPPVSAPGEDLYVTINSEVILDGTRSFDEDGEITNYIWDYSDCINVGFECEENCVAGSPTVTLKSPGIANQTCRAILTVEDNDAPPNFSEEWAGEDLFISEYAEGLPSQDTYIEIYNGTDSTLDLSNYSLEITRNNGATYDLILDDNSTGFNDGFLNPGNVLIVIRNSYGQLCNENYDFLQCELNNIQFIEWNNINKISGNDAVSLYHNNLLVDIIGVPGEDPGSAWDVGGVEDATKNHTLLRKPNITEGNTDWIESAGDENNSEWYVYPLETYYFGGYHYQDYDNIIYGCMDTTACNYLSEANTDFPTYSLCEYESCLDCLGTPNGNAIEDECGICDGPGAIYECGCNDMQPWACDCDNTELDCAGECGGDSYYDQCGECDNDPLNDCVQDECGIWGGPGAVYECGCYCESENINYLNNWDDGYENYYESYGVADYNDIWGYTDSDGNEYALIGTWNGTHIIDINTSAPFEVAFIPGSASTHRDIKTYGHYMYVGTEANLPDPELLEDNINYTQPQGIQVVDILDPTNPVLVNEWDGVVQSHNIMEEDGFLYVIGSFSLNSLDGTEESWGLDDLIILDLSDPANPVKIGGWSGVYIHDVCIFDDVLYGCGIETDDMWAIDISDKTNPQAITSWDGIPSAHACWVSDDGNTLFTASETTGGHIMSWDVTDLTNINLLDEWMPPGAEMWSAHNIFIKNERLYISYYVYGLQILDVSDPSNMYRLGYFDSLDEIGLNLDTEDIYSSAWGTYPYFNSEKIIISDMSRGLFVVDDYNLQGDLNDDDIIDVVDIIAMVNIILDDSYDSSADINQNGIVDIVDIIAMINIILE